MGRRCGWVLGALGRCGHEPARRCSSGRPGFRALTRTVTRTDRCPRFRFPHTSPHRDLGNQGSHVHVKLPSRQDARPQVPWNQGFVYDCFQSFERFYTQRPAAHPSGDRRTAPALLGRAGRRATADTSRSLGRAGHAGLLCGHRYYRGGKACAAWLV